ncbi:MAG: carboxypeptidase-like regulatory domain-containing protein, partial [Crocinitomicaceae bacterium]
MRYFILIICFLFASQLHSQYVLKGIVTDHEKMPVPGARVFIENTTYGVITNYKGEYFLELKVKGIYPIAFKMVSMKDTTISVTISNKVTLLNMSLTDYSLELETVEVSSKKIDVAKMVIKAMQNNRSNLANQYENYESNTYLKTGLEKS